MSNDPKLFLKISREMKANKHLLWKQSDLSWKCGLTVSKLSDHASLSPQDTVIEEAR